MTSGVSVGTLAPSSFCWPNLGCKSPLAETPKGSVCWEKVEPSRFRCGQAIAVNRGNRGSVQRILGRERAYMEEKGLPSSLPQGCKSRPHFKIAFFAYVYVYPVIFTGGGQNEWIMLFCIWPVRLLSIYNYIIYNYIIVLKIKWFDRFLYHN